MMEGALIVAEQLHHVHERLHALEQRMNHELATKGDLAAGLVSLGDQLREELATKEDLVQLREEAVEDRRQANLELYATVRQDMHQLKRELTGEIVSHVGALGDQLSGQLSQQIGWLERRLRPQTPGA